MTATVVAALTAAVMIITTLFISEYFKHRAANRRRLTGGNKKTHHSILIRWSDADECYIASLPELGEYAKTHGDTPEEALQNAKTVLSLLGKKPTPTQTASV